MTAALAAELTWRQVHAFRVRRHHLAERARNRELAAVVGAVAAVQAQLMSAAELQIVVRAASSVEDVRLALWKSRTLVKTWLMRGTLHLSRADDLPLYTAAMSRFWIRPSNAWLSFFHVTEAEVWALAEDIGQTLGDTPMTREELISAVGAHRSSRVREALKSGWGGMLKPAARNGWLCFGPNRGHSVTFVRPSGWLSAWSEVDPETALVEVARRYLRAYGPATKEDFSRWWGAWTGVGKAAWSSLAGELVPVMVEGKRMDLLEADLDDMRGAGNAEAVRLLPQFDPYLLGHANRDHLFERVHAPKVSRTAGWISAVVLVDGRVAGTWTHKIAARRLDVTVTPFARLAAGARRQVATRAQEIAAALGVDGVAVKFD